MYAGDEWCGALNKTNGLWSECAKIDTNGHLENIIRGCMFDMCSYEQTADVQNELRCNAYKKAADKCIAMADRKNIKLTINWRSKMNCRKFMTCIILRNRDSLSNGIKIINKNFE